MEVNASWLSLGRVRNRAGFDRLRGCHAIHRRNFPEFEKRLEWFAGPLVVAIFAAITRALLADDRLLIAARTNRQCATSSMGLGC
jgi:hypothetical protein